MRDLVRCAALLAMLVAATATLGQAAPQTPAKTAKAVPARLSAADEAKLKAMIAQHQKVRSRLSAEYQTELDQLTAQVKKRLFAAPIPVDLLASATPIVSRMIPGLTAPEATSLAEYVLGGSAVPANATSPMQETQMSFNLQYLQLQSQMQNENRSYTAVSNIMKTKHDTVKNSISNIR